MIDMEVPSESTLYIQLILFFVSLCICALYSFLETSVTALRLFKLKELADEVGGKYKKVFHVLENNPQHILITILIANSLANVTAAALITNVMENFFARLNFSSGLGLSVGIGIATVAILVFGEIIPKNFARTRGEKIFRSTLWIVSLTYYLFYPFARLLTHFSNLLVHKFGDKKMLEGVSEWVSSEKEIKFLIDHISKRGLMETEKTEMLQNIFDLGRTPVKEIMVPATDVISVDLNATIQDVLDAFGKYHFTRLPVYDENRENIVGMVHLKDILQLLIHGEEKPLKDILRPILFVPESLKVNQLLRELRQKHRHLGIVLNEHGIVTGLITLEDVLEEIVGEISDEHERITEKIIKLAKGGWLVDASSQLDEVSELLDIPFEAESSITLGGFLTEQLQHLPKKGERFLYKGYYFQIQQATPKRVLQVLVFEEKKPEESLEETSKK